MLGSSVTRGSFQSLVDSLVPEAWELTAGVKNLPGEGTSVKCWGWLDFQVDGLRLSFQDFRNPGYTDEQLGVAAARMKRLLSEGPDLLVIESFPLKSPQFASIIQSVLPRHFEQKPKAKVILKRPHRHPFFFAGNTMGGGESWQNRTVETFMSSLPPWSRSSAGRLIAIDETCVSLPLFLDFEFTVQSHRAVVHWHRYDEAKTKGRKDFGTAADVWAHVYLTELLRQANYESSGKPEASPQFVAGCAQCPPRLTTSRAVPENLKYTLASTQDLPLIGSWSNLTMQSCGQLVVPNGAQ